MGLDVSVVISMLRNREVGGIYMGLKQFIRKYGTLIFISTLILGYKHRQYIVMLKNTEEYRNFIASFGYYFLPGIPKDSIILVCGI